MDSILGSIKKMLGIGVDDTNFDHELILHINGALNIVNQLGVGPSEGFLITDVTQNWQSFIGTRTDLEIIKTDIFLRVRLMFDPPQNSFLVSAIQKQIEEYDWRITVQTTPPIVPEVPVEV
jgi:hypothetical protein